MKRALFVAFGASIVACSLVAPLDYLQEDLGKPLPDEGGTPPSESGPPTDGPAPTKTPTMVAQGLEQPRLLRADADTLYWTTGNPSRTLNAMPKAGGSPRVVMTFPQKVVAVAVDDAAIFVAWGSTVTRLTKAATDDAGTTSLFTAPQPLSDLAFDNAHTGFFVGWNAAVAHVPVTGGQPVTILDNTVTDGAYGFAEDDKYVYYASPDDTVYRQDKAKAVPDGGTLGGEPFSDPNAATEEEFYPEIDVGLRVEGATDGAMFWTQHATDESLAYNNGVFRSPVIPGAKPLPLVMTPSVGLALDGTHAYYTNPETGEAGRVAKTGGNPEILLAKLAKPMEVLLDGTTVYVLAQGTSLMDGAIVKFEK